MNEKAIEAALKAWFASPPSETDQGLERSMKAALTAAIPHFAPPLRAREEITRARRATISTFFAHHTRDVVLVQTIDALTDALLSSTAGQEWRDISQRIEDYIIGVVREVAELPDRTSPGYDGDMMMVTADELASILRCRFIDGDGNMMTSPLPEPIVAEQRPETKNVE